MSDPSSLGPNRSWFLDINEWAKDTPWLHGVMKAYAGYGVVLFGLLLLAGYLLARRSHSPRLLAAALWSGISVLLAVAVNQPIVHGVNERRPYAVLPDMLLLAKRSVDASFPSDHATMAGAVAAGLLLISWRLGVVAVVAALLMAFARVYVGAHYPVDVLAGLALGATVTALGWLVLRAPLTWLIERASATRLRVLVPVS